MNSYEAIRIGGIIVLVLASCGKSAPEEPSAAKENPTREVILSLHTRPGTRTAAVTCVSTLYWSTTTGGDESGTSEESPDWDQDGEAFCSPVSDNTVPTGLYVDGNDPPTKNWYAANIPFPATYPPCLDAENSTDVVAARLYGYAGWNPSVTLEHIFARIGSLTMAPQENYSISDISWTLRGKMQPFGTSGRYDLATGGWSACTGLSAATPLQPEPDLFLIPGEYIIGCSYTLSRNGASQQVSVSGEVTLESGMVHTISGTAVGGTLSDIQFSVQLSPWWPIHTTTEES